MKVISSIFHRVVIKNENSFISDILFLTFEVNVCLDIKSRDEEAENILNDVSLRVHISSIISNNITHTNHSYFV